MFPGDEIIVSVPGFLSRAIIDVTDIMQDQACQGALTLAGAQTCTRPAKHEKERPLLISE